jgi:hypothetical protein
MKACLQIKMIALVTLLFMGKIYAQTEEPLLNFNFKHLSNYKSAELFEQTQQDYKITQNVQSSLNDMTLTYPWKSRNFNVDLGITVRRFSTLKTGNAATGVENSTLSLFHASALYNTSLKGLSAGVEGNHLDLNNRPIFDYRAKLSYEWRNGFGMQGGWQHQQLDVDNTADLNSDSVRKGPFFDLYLNF